MRLLAEASFTSDSFGQLRFGHRFLPLTQGIDLPADSYSIVVHGWSANNPPTYFNLPGFESGVRFEAEDQRFGIVPIGYRCEEKIPVGVFPRFQCGANLHYACGSFEFEPAEEE